nr:hypothetical protein [Pseudomonas kitaguniensis]
MVRAILKGRKTVTRRMMKSQPDADATITVESYNVAVTNRRGYQEAGPEIFGAWWRDGESGCKCPYGQPGDRLWVRETWAADAQVDAIAPRDLSQGEPIQYQADGAVRQTGSSMITLGKGRPSIHMPRWVSRILLEITAVRVERLQDITEDQAKAEGVRRVELINRWFAHDDSENAFGTATGAFRDLWQSVGGDWDANPWVWVIEFRRR